MRTRAELQELYDDIEKMEIGLGQYHEAWRQSFMAGRHHWSPAEREYALHVFFGVLSDDSRQLLADMAAKSEAWFDELGHEELWEKVKGQGNSHPDEIEINGRIYVPKED